MQAMAAIFIVDDKPPTTPTADQWQSKHTPRRF